MQMASMFLCFAILLPMFDGVLVTAKGLMTSQPASTTEEVPVNGTIMQYFEWYLPDDGQHWDRLGADAEHLNEIGITSVWIPPAYKGHVGTSDVGYGVYDFYDLGEFNQKGTVRTKYGKKEQLQNAVGQLHAQDVQVYADIVVNHLMGADASESVRAVEVNPHNRNQDISGEFNHTAWTAYNYDGRNNAHSSFKWRAEHFDGVDDWGKSYRFANKKWDWEVSTENGNYDYLMGTDLDFDHPDVAQEIKDWGVWYTEEMGLDGFRLDAVKHIKYEFMRDFVNYVRAETGKEMFTVGEFIGGQGDLQRYLDVVDHNMSLFDFPLRNNFAEASSSNGNFDMRQLSNNTLVGSNPMHAVTFVENHDTQPDRDDAHGAPVLDWFKPLAYAYILTREEGYPQVFYGDYYGTNGTNGNDIAPLRDQLDPLLLARKNNAYGTQHDYLDDADLIGWTREGHPSKPGSGLATVMTNSSGGTKNMYVGTQHAGSTWIDTTGNIKSSVTIDSSGYGNFSVKDGSVSVWVPEDDGSQHDELPTTPENLRATTSDSTVELEWNASNDDNGVTNYEVYRNNKLIAEPINPHYIDQGVQSNTTYNYRVRAVDTAGQRSGFSSTVTVKTSDSDDDDDDDDIPDPTELVNKPFSWDNANVYFVLPDRFYNGNTSNDNSYGRPQQDAWGKNIGTFHGGDIKGLTQKLEEGYFTELGTNAIWITAPWEQIHGWVGGGSGGDFAHYAYHGYYGLDFTAMDQNMGTIDEMREFVDLAHSLGIRVVLDIVMNHVGYPTIVDMHDFGFGDSGGLSRNWTPDRGQGQDWHTHNDVINKDNAAAWANWWGRDWIRADETAGYDNGGSSEISMNLSFLPDVKTETTTGVSLPPILKNKWNDQSSGSEDWLVPAAEPYRQELNIAPKDYMVKWLTSWVEEFGVDGFRVDTAKHVEIDRWAQLKDEAEVALQTWRENNPDRPGANWDDDFWMTAEVFGHGLGKSEYFDNGFDSVINFDFQKANKNDLEGLFSRYAKEINNDPDYNMLSYISSHDTALYNRSDLIQAGTALLLLPGGVQTFYGDETARPMGDGGSDPEQGTRSSMKWDNIDQTVLSHWQKLGQFRNDHIAVGAGEHQQLSSEPYTFSRVYESDELIDEVVIAVGAQGTTEVTVEGIFEDGTVVRDAYTGNETKVTNGIASFAAGNQGIILIENTTEPKTNLPVVSASPGSSSFRTDEITVALNLDRAESGKYTLDGSNPEDGIAFTDGEELTIGADMEFDEVVTLRLYAENENGTKTRSYTYRKLDPDAVLEVYFQKPADWETPQIYYFDTLPEETEVTWNTAPTMTQVEGDWYVYIFENAQSANILFKDSSGRQIPGPSEPGFLVENVGWYDGQKWLDSDPFESGPKDPATTPENLRGIAVTETTVTLKWDRSDGHVVEYEVLRDGDVVGTTTQTTYTDQNLNPDTTYTYSVVAVGDEGQRSTPSEVVEVTTFKENPVVKEPAETPENLRLADVTESTVTINWNVSNGYVTGYEILRDGVVVGETSETTFTDNGLDPATTYTYAVVALGDADQKSEASEELEVTTQEELEGNYVTVYYKHGFDTPHMHYRPEGGEWTTAPGVRMEESEIAGYSKLSVDIGEAAKLEVAFNDGRGAWDSDNENNYLFEPGIHTYVPSHHGRGVTIPGRPDIPAEGNKVTIYYKRGFDTPHVHYRPEGGTWTDAPGLPMEDSEYADYSKLTIDIGEARQAEVAFNNGRGTWDSNNENNYLFEIGDNTYIPGHNGSPGDVNQGKPTPQGEGNEVTIYYKRGFDTPHVHYRPEGGTWTNAPGIKMEESEVAGYSKVTLDIGRATRAEVAFNDGRGAWDSDNERNYFFVVGNNTYEPGINGAPGQVKQGELPYGEEDPGDNKEPEQSPPSRPTDLTATATASTVSLSWTASTDNVEVAGYRVYRDGKEVGVTDTTTYTDTGLRAETSYIYEVQAYDTSDNSSALSDELIIETAEEAVVEPGGNMPYSTNPSFGKRVSTPITIDGVNDGEWTDDMLIAIGMAGDDPRTLGENWSVHETPMDLSHLWAAWDHEYLYLAWQYVDVTDVIDPANAGSSAGTPISSMDMLQTIAIDTIPGQGASLDMWGKNGGETLWGGPDLPDYQLNLASNLWHSGYISRAVDGVFPVDDEGVDYRTGKDAGIEAAFSAGKGYNELWSVFDADHANDPSELVEFLELGHDPTRDTFYEVKIPLSAIGDPDIENQGLGVMIHQGEFSAMDTLPNDPASSDTIGVSESNSPLEWQDIDLFTAPFARIGQ